MGYAAFEMEMWNLFCIGPLVMRVCYFVVVQ